MDIKSKEITIKIRRESEKDSKNSEASKAGLIRLKKRRKPKNRRAVTNAKIKFFDLSYYTFDGGEIFQDLYYPVNGALQNQTLLNAYIAEVNSSNSNSARLPLPEASLTAEQYEQRDDFLFQVAELPELKNIFFPLSRLIDIYEGLEISGSDFFELELYNGETSLSLKEIIIENAENTNWTNAGLVLPPGFLAAAISNNSFQVTTSFLSFDLLTGNHITSEYDFNAPAAAFIPSDQMNLYFCPDILMYARAAFFTNPGGVVTSSINGLEWRTFPGKTMFDPEFEFFGILGTSYFRWLRSDNAEGSLTHYNLTYYLFRNNFFGNFSFISPFPVPPASPYTTSPNGQARRLEFGIRNGRTAFYYPKVENTLLAIIEQNGVFFYVWDA